jgi:hypothetical protein
MSERTEAAYLASLTAIIRELILVKQEIDARILSLIEELGDNAWFSDYYGNLSPQSYKPDLDYADDYKMD